MSTPVFCFPWPFVLFTILSTGGENKCFWFLSPLLKQNFCCQCCDDEWLTLHVEFIYIISYREDTALPRALNFIVNNDIYEKEEFDT